jgi:hypothetical protein
MAKQVSIENTLIYNLEVDITENSMVSKRIEECHGFHEFTDIEVESVEVNKVIIRFDTNDFIDITDRLTKEEKNKLSEYQS